MPVSLFLLSNSWSSQGSIRWAAAHGDRFAAVPVNFVDHANGPTAQHFKM